MKKQRIIPAPVISTAFVTEDIHKIREWNYERRGDVFKTLMYANKN